MLPSAARLCFRPSHIPWPPNSQRTYIEAYPDPSSVAQPARDGPATCAKKTCGHLSRLTVVLADTKRNFSVA